MALSHDSPTCREASGRGGRLATGLVDVRLDVGFELHDPRSDVKRLVRTPRSEPRLERLVRTPRSEPRPATRTRQRSAERRTSAWRRASSTPSSASPPTCGSTSASSSTTRGPTSSASCGRPTASGRPATRTRQRSAERRTSRLLARQRSAERRTSGLMSEVCTDYDDAGEAAQRRSSGSVSEVYPGAASRHATLCTVCQSCFLRFQKDPDSTELDVSITF